MTAAIGRALLGLCWLGIAACRQDPGTPVAEIEATPDGIAAAASTESALSIKRGIVSLTGDTRSFLPCGESSPLWLVDQAGDGLDDAYARLAGEPGSALYVEARGERTMGEASLPAGFAGRFLLEELLHAAAPGEGGSCSAPVPAWRVLARGNEPFWAVEIHAQRMLLRTPDAPDPLEFSVAESLDAEGSVRFAGEQGRQRLDVIVTDAPCSDSMSGEFFAYTAQAHLDGVLLQGCARLGE